MRILASVAATGLILLGACSSRDQATGDAANGNVADAASQASATGDAGASPLPVNPKPGLWAMKMTGQNAMAMGGTMQVCVGKPKPGQNAFAPQHTPGTECSKQEVKRVSDGAEIAMVCVTDGVTTDTQMKVTGDFNTAWKNEMKARLSGKDLPKGMPLEMAMTIEAQYLGACPAEIKPGQVKLETGQVLGEPQAE